MEQKFDLHNIADKTKQLIKFYKEDYCIYGGSGPS